MRHFIIWVEKYSIPIGVFYEMLVIILPLLMSNEIRMQVFPTQFISVYGCLITIWSFVGIFILVVIRVAYTVTKNKCVTEITAEKAGLQKAVEEYQSKIQAIEKVVPSALNGILESLKLELDLGNDDRISLYLVEEIDGGLHYFCCGRCSSNLKHESRSCRMRPLAKMFKKIWDEGRFFDDKFPKIMNTKKGLRDYEAYCKRTYDLSSSEVQKIRFKGRAYWGMRIDYTGEHLAFIVISSLKKEISGKREDQIEIIVKPSCQKLGAVIHAFKEYIPSPSRVADTEEF